MSRSKSGFLNKLKDYFECLPFDINGKTLCVCLSGGADSVSLLLGMLEIKDLYSLNICACHFNHLIRGEEADNDENFCKDLCKDLNVKLYCGRDDVPLYAKTYKLSTEDAARQCRYLFFKRVLEKNNIDFCATAHNMNDDAETLLLNLLRGSGSDGAASIAPYNDNILRPMLKITREEVEEYLVASSQQYVTDSTNFSNDYTRNFIRNTIFPKLKKINPSFVNSFSKFIDSARLDKEYFDNIIDEKLDVDLRTEHKSIRYRVFVKKCKDMFGVSLNREQLEQIDKALFSESRVVIPLNSRFEAIVNNGNVNFSEISKECGLIYDTVDLKEGSNCVFDGKVLIDLSKSNVFKKVYNLSIQTVLSSANISGGLCVRNRRVGDRIKIHGINKSIKKMLIDKKVPKEYRDVIPIICDSEGIVYVPFVGVCDRAFSKSNDGCIFINIVFNSIDKERWVNAYEK